jgi:anthranilate phosphoribosyltransferase
MSIAKYIKEIGRGKEGARSISREQAADLMGQVLDGAVTDLEIGGFCLAMRIKGETPAEMAGFLDAAHARLNKVHALCPVVVLPSYNGARKLPVLTPLLGLLLAREGARRALLDRQTDGSQKGFAVLMHGCKTEDARVHALEVIQALNFEQKTSFDQQNRAWAATELIASEVTPNTTHSIKAGDFKTLHTNDLLPSLKRLLDVRRAVGLRNPAHSMVKLMNPTTTQQALVISSYTHPEYLQSMTAVFELTGSHAMLLRGTEGECVADARRTPQMDGFVHGQRSTLQAPQGGPLATLPDLPGTTDAAATAAYIQDVLQGRKPVPAPIARQVECILQLMDEMRPLPHEREAQSQPQGAEVLR